VIRTAAWPRLGNSWAGRKLAFASTLAVLVGLAGTGLVADWLAGDSVPPAARTASQSTASPAVVAGRARALDASRRLPLAFEANHGQRPPAVRFLARSASGTLLLSGDGATLAYARSGERPAAALRLTFPGSAAVAVVGERRLPGSVSYLSGSDRVAGVPTYGRVAYRDVWPGVDAAFYGDARRLEYDLLVAPGADPGRIRLGFGGHRAMRISAAGDLLLALPGGRVVRELAPVAYQLVGGRRRAVASRFVLAGQGQVGIEVGRYDPRATLVIDPIMACGSYETSH
jgi:hypothetical protein